MRRFNRYRQSRTVAETHAENNNNNVDCKDVSIRKLYVAPIKPNIQNKIETYFASFGEVESVKLCWKDSFQFGFVQFKMAESAQAALVHPSHRIANCHFKVKPADVWHQPEYGQPPNRQQEPPNPLLVAPETHSPLHILIALNDDCLEAVFERLDLLDLANAAGACVRFNLQAKETFAKKYTTLKLDRELLDYKSITKDEADKILRNFGSMIRTLKIDGLVLESNPNSKVPFLRIASRHCTALKELQMDSFEIKGKLKKSRALFEKLEKLHVEYTEFSKATTDLNRVCTELKSLKLAHCDLGFGNSLRQQFAKLEEARLLECYNFPMGVLDGFINMNPTLTKLSIVKTDCWLKAKHLHSIGQNLKRLIELEIDQHICDINPNCLENLAQLNELKVLKLHFNQLPVTPLLKRLVENKVPMEQLKINSGHIDNSTIECLTKMKALKMLNFTKTTGAITDEHLIQLANGLPHLDELHFDESENDITTIGLKKMLVHANKMSLLHLNSVYDISIDVDDYKAMLKTVKNRREKLKLVIRIISDGDNVKVDEKMLADNRDIFYIDEEIEEDPSMHYGSETDDDMFDDDDYFGLSDDDFWYHDSDADSEDGFGLGLGAYMNGHWYFLS